MDMLHETLDMMVKKAPKGTVIIQVSRDSTALAAREKAAKKRTEKKEKKRRGRPKKGETRLPPPENKRERQVKQSGAESIQELETDCFYGCKKKSQGNV
jgi:hypothetical protein